MHRFDLWNIKYLKRFKWDHLTEEMGERCTVLIRLAVRQRWEGATL